MVFYFEPRGYTRENGMVVYMGRDKYENEELIRYGFDEDIWCVAVYFRVNLMGRGAS